MSDRILIKQGGRQGGKSIEVLKYYAKTGILKGIKPDSPIALRYNKLRQKYLDEQWGRGHEAAMGYPNGLPNPFDND